jgi:hypothetical protein
MELRAQALAALLSSALSAGPAVAHDSWLEERAAPPGRLELALTTGSLFPAGQTAIAAESLVDRGCISAQGKRVALQAGPASESALRLQAPRRGAEPLRGCWVQTTAFDVQIDPAIVPIYLREIAAPEAVRNAWAEQQRLGLPWVERYTKHARITLAAAGADASPMPAVPPTVASMALDIEIESPGPLRVGQTLGFRVLRDGRPLAEQAVELRGDMNRLGVWRRTDPEGRASVPLPFAGHWVLRATDLRPTPGQPGHWESRFITHTFSVTDAPSATQPSKPAGMPNARSTNQSDASAAINAEPPISTARR